MKFLFSFIIGGLFLNLHAITLENDNKLNSFSMIVETDY